MNVKATRYGFAAALAGLLMSGAAQAVVIQPGSETSLNDLFNAPGSGWIKSGPALDVNGSEQKTSTAWMVGATTLSTAGIIVELAGNAAFNTFGIYDISNPNNRLELFSGADSEGDNAVLKQVTTNQFKNLLTGTTATFSSSKFGFYLGIPQAPGYFYSDPGLNGGQDQMVAFQGGKGRTADFHDVATLPWLSNEWVLAWEDVSYGNSDKDFNDFVVTVESVDPTPVPEPTTLALLGTGLLFSSRLAKRRQKKEAEAAAA